jgi:hypothetical protein
MRRTMVHTVLQLAKVPHSNTHNIQGDTHTNTSQYTRGHNTLLPMDPYTHTPRTRLLWISRLTVGVVVRLSVCVVCIRCIARATTCWGRCVHCETGPRR